MSGKIGYIARISLIILATIIACGDKQGEMMPGNELNAGETIKWYNLNEGLATAKKSGKNIFIFFYTDWCFYCKKMNNEVFSDAEVISYMNRNFISIKANPEIDNSSVVIMGRPTTVAQLVRACGVEGYPGLVFWDKNQKPVTTIPGFIEKKVFLPVLKYMASECYMKRIPLNDYIEGKISCGKTVD